MKTKLWRAMKRKLWKTILHSSYKAPDAIKRFLTNFTIVCLKILSWNRNKPYFKSRLLLSNMLPWDPLHDKSPSELSVFLLTTRKDLEVLGLSIYSVKKNIAFGGSQLIVVTPVSDLEVVSKIIDENFPNLGIVAMSDEAILEDFNLDRSVFPNSHCLMLILKFLCVLTSPSDDCIVLDGDTIFLRRRTWSDSENLVLVVPPEYICDHVYFVETNFPDVKHFKLGYTTQSQVMRKFWIQEMITSYGGIIKFAELFADAMAKHLEGQPNKAFPSEWQLLGDWLLTFRRDHIVFGSYINLSLDRSIELSLDSSWDDRERITRLYQKIEQAYPNIGSVSLHAHRDSSVNK